MRKGGKKEKKKKKILIYKGENNTCGNAAQGRYLWAACVKTRVPGTFFLHLDCYLYFLSEKKTHVIETGFLKHPADPAPLETRLQTLETCCCLEILAGGDCDKGLSGVQRGFALSLERRLG